MAYRLTRKVGSILFIILCNEMNRVKSVQQGILYGMTRHPESYVIGLIYSVIRGQRRSCNDIDLVVHIRIIAEQTMIEF